MGSKLLPSFLAAMSLSCAETFLNPRRLRPYLRPITLCSLKSKPLAGSWNCSCPITVRTRSACSQILSSGAGRR